MTQIQFGKINNLFESPIIYTCNLIFSKNQFLYNDRWKRLNMNQFIFPKWNFHDRLIRPLRILKGIVQISFSAIYKTHY